MKPISFFPLYNNYFKYLGLFISLGALLLLALLKENYDILLYFGLLIIAFSKEKSENEMVINTRNEIFKFSFGLYISLMIALNIVELLSQDFTFNPSRLIYIGLPLGFYLVIFYLSLIFNIKLNSTITVKENIVENKKIYLLWLVFVVTIFILYYIVK